MVAGSATRRARTSAAERRGRARADYARAQDRHRPCGRLASRSGFASADVARSGRHRAALLQPDRAWAREPGAALETLGACAAALNVQLAAFFEAMPGADLPRDIEHLRRQNLVVATAQAGAGRRSRRRRVDEGRWSRSIDVLLSRAARREAAVVEIWDLLLDGGEAMRGLDGEGRRRCASGSGPRGASRACSSCAERTGTAPSSASCDRCSRRRYPASSAGVAPSADR